jgi:hypothetical protein
MFRSPTLAFGPVLWLQAATNAGALAAAAFVECACPTVANRLVAISAAALAATISQLRRLIRLKALFVDEPSSLPISLTSKK